jgi:hypothetical protein
VGVKGLIIFTVFDSKEFQQISESTFSKSSNVLEKIKINKIKQNSSKNPR